VGEKGDLVFAESMAAACGAAHLLLQPAWDNPRGLALAIAHVQRHAAWRLSLQSHKWLGLR
jgi:hypothetical protein